MVAKAAVRLIPKSAAAPAARILHVEDDPAIARCIASLLRREGYEVVSVSSASDAFVELATRRFDLVLSDFNLSGAGNGADVLAAVRMLVGVPFLFLTSDDRADEYGVPRLDKPSSPSALRDAIAALIEPAKTVKEMPLDGAFDIGAL